MRKVEIRRGRVKIQVGFLSSSHIFFRVNIEKTKPQKGSGESASECGLPALPLYEKILEGKPFLLG
jgi:hypothetical protein